jgi:hypothetical protein
MEAFQQVVINVLSEHKKVNYSKSSYSSCSVRNNIYHVMIFFQNIFKLKVKFTFIVSMQRLRKNDMKLIDQFVGLVLVCG